MELTAVRGFPDATLLPFEIEVNRRYWLYYMEESMAFTLKMSFAYVTFIYFGERLMKDRRPFELRVPLIVWNTALALLSALGVIRLLPEFMYALFENSFEYSMCGTESYDRKVVGLWLVIFAWSKVVELGDTVFLVLRKKPVTFLHWFHHASVLVYTWMSMGSRAACGRWFIMVNFNVHAFMYAYYAVRAAGVRRIPKCVPMTITCMQLSQMVMGILININTARINFTTTRQCEQSNKNLIFGALMYSTYFFMFINYFYKAYFASGGKHNPTVSKGESASKFE